MKWVHGVPVLKLADLVNQYDQNCAWDAQHAAQLFSEIPDDWSCKMLTQSCWISAASKRKLRLLDLQNTDNPSTNVSRKEVVSSCLLSLYLYIYTHVPILALLCPSPAGTIYFIVWRLSLEVLQEGLHDLWIWICSKLDSLGLKTVALNGEQYHLVLRKNRTSLLKSFDLSDIKRKIRKDMSLTP